MSLPEKSPSLQKNRYLAFNNGRLLPDSTLDWIIGSALRGRMTPSGEKLLLIPDTRKGLADSSGRRQIGKFRKADCLTLKQLIRKMGRLGIRPKERKTVKKHEVNQSIKNRKIRSRVMLSDCHFLHKERDVNELKNASVQVSP